MSFMGISQGSPTGRVKLAKPSPSIQHFAKTLQTVHLSGSLSGYSVEAEPIFLDTSDDVSHVRPPSGNKLV